ncbi:MAG: hypothetical protein KAK00_00080 [Nanoarchaeota archaeon]|nr:hypothetical protein [Nanoarchaeota archaeon]
MESSYCKIPCICPDKVIFKEVYENKIIYFKENNINDLVDKIKDLIKREKSDINNLGINGKIYIKNRFSLEKFAKK